MTLSGIYRQDTLITSPIQVLKVDASTGKDDPCGGNAGFSSLTRISRS